MEMFDEALSDLRRNINEKKEKILEEVAAAGIDPRLIRFDVEYRTEEREKTYFLSAIIIPRFIPTEPRR